MKGFLYLVETAVAAVLVAIIISSVFGTQSATIDWTRADLIGVGNNLFDTFGRNISLVLNTTSIFDDIDLLKPANVKYTLRFRGIPKEKIVVGTNDPVNIPKYLDPSYLNGRFIEYDIYGFNEDDPIDDFDVIILREYDDYNDPKIVAFSKDKVVIGIEDGTVADADMLNYFKLTKFSPPETQVPLSFVNYNDIVKYFLGIGFIIKTETNDPQGNMYGTWYIKNTQQYVKISGEPEMCIDSSHTCTPSIPERGYFDYLDERYLIKYINWPDVIYLGVKENNFEFTSDFAYGNIDSGIGAEKIIGNDDYAAMTKYENRIWISDPGLSNINTEYKTLIQAAVASSVTDWYIDEPDSENTVEVSRFTGLCCDIPETVEISFVLWYVF